MGRLRSLVAVLAVLTAGILAGSAAPIRLDNIWSGQWTTNTGALGLRWVTDSEGSSAIVSQGGRPCGAPTDYFRGGYTTTAGDSGKVTGCTAGNTRLVARWVTDFPKQSRNGTFDVTYSNGTFSGRYQEDGGGSGSYTGTFKAHFAGDGHQNGGPPGVHFKVDTHANDVRVGAPLVGWWQLCLSRLNGSGNLDSNGSLINGGKLWHFNKCPAHKGGPRTLDESVMWQVVRSDLTTQTVNLNFGDHAPTEVKTLTLTANAIQSVNRKLCPLGTQAVITLREDRRQLTNGNSMDFAEVKPAGGACPGQTQGWSNADNPNNDPPHGGLSGGQHAQVNIDERSANS